jgi:superfamily II DNA helicase RecQ
LTKLCDKVKDVFRYLPCLWQAQDALSQLRREYTVSIAATSSGKTLTFMIPKLFDNGGITLLITVLNILGDQNVAKLARAKVSTINLMGKNLSDRAFWVSGFILRCTWYHS